MKTVENLNKQSRRSSLWLDSEGDILFWRGESQSWAVIIRPGTEYSELFTDYPGVSSLYGPFTRLYKAPR